VAEQEQQRERHRRDFLRRRPARGLDPALDQRFELLRQQKQTDVLPVDRQWIVSIPVRGAGMQNDSCDNCHRDVPSCTGVEPLKSREQPSCPSIRP